MSLKPSSRARLTRYTLPEFQGPTLLDALGRAVCEAEALPRKELYESWEVARRVRRRLRGGHVVELAAGHGLLSAMLLLLDPSSSHALCVDTRRPLNAERLREQLVARWPRLDEQLSYQVASLEEAPLTRESVVVSVHACKRLTDRVLERAIAARARVAVLPCCQSAKLSGTAGLEGWLEPRLAVDVARAVRLQQAGYRITTQCIPAEITPANRLLIGEPEEGAASP